LAGGEVLVRIEKSIEIKASPEKVWEMLAFDRRPEWMEGIKSVKYTSKVHTSEDKYKVGASAHMIEKHGESDLEITESLENEKMVYSVRGYRGSKSTIGILTLKSTQIGTEITFVIDYDVTNVGFKILDKLFLEKALEKDVKKFLEKLKSILEK
jgi:uncharacterized membrane protein